MARRKPRGQPRNSANKGDNNQSTEKGGTSNFAGNNKVNSRPGVPQTQDARNFRSVDKVQGISPLELRSVSTIGTSQQNRIVEIETPSEQSEQGVQRLR